MAERVPCNVLGCERTILPETATRTQGRCMPCVQREAAEERRRCIEANRVDVDRFAGVTDRIELIKLAHQRPPHDALKRYLPPPMPLAEMYRDLNAGDVQRMITVAVRFVEGGMYGAGEGVAQDLAKAQEYLRAARRNRHPEAYVAMRRLGIDPE